MDPDLSVSIIGAGPAGIALAADLQSRGISVLLYAHPAHRRHANRILHHHGGLVRVTGILSGTTSLRITSDISEAVSFSRLLVFTVPSTGQETVLDSLRGFPLQNHTIVAIPGNLISLIISGMSDLNVGCVLETNLSPYSCRMDDADVLTVMGKKSVLWIGALGRLDADVYEAVSAIIPAQLRWCSGVVEVSLANINGVFHPVMMLMNAGWIESTGGDFMLYKEGLSPAVGRAMTAIDEVRVAIGEAMGLSLQSAVEVSNECYNQGFGDPVDLARRSPPHNRLKAPDTLDHRNISEDVPDLLVCWLGLAEKLGVEATPLRAIIAMAEMATGRDYAREGRNLTRLHLDGLSRAELVKRFGTQGRKDVTAERELVMSASRL